MQNIVTTIDKIKKKNTIKNKAFLSSITCSEHLKMSYLPALCKALARDTQLVFSIETDVRASNDFCETR